MNITIVTAVGRIEMPEFKRALERSIASVPGICGPNATRWVRAADGNIQLPELQIPGVEVVDVPSVGFPTGPGPTRNRALPHLLDGWVIALDSDDILKASGLGQILANAESSDVGWVAGLADDIDEEGRVTYEGPDLLGGNRRLSPGEFVEIAESLGIVPWRVSGSMAIRSELLRLSGGWAESPDLQLSEDVAMAARVTSEARGLWDPVVVSYYRRHRDGITAGLHRPFLADWQSIRGYADSLPVPCGESDQRGLLR